MNRLMYASIVLIITGCATTSVELWQTELRSYGYDFRPYTEQGFLFTPEKYLGEYEAVGLVDIVYVPEIIKSSSEGRPPNRDGYRIITSGTAAGGGYYYVEIPDTDRLIAELYDLASGLGADALTNFNMATETLFNGGVSIPTIKVSGFAIKRL
jgi:hypothetical protein